MSKPNYCRIEVREIHRSHQGIVTEVRTGTAVSTVIVADEAALSQMRDALYWAWRCGFGDARRYPEFTAFGDPL